MGNNTNIKTLVRGAYDIQKLRIQMGNRIVGNFKAKLGQKPGKSEDELDAEGKHILQLLRQSFKKITDGVKTFPRQAGFEGDEVISSYTELCLIAAYVKHEQNETEHFRRFGNVLTEYPIYTDYLKGVKGVGPAMAGVIISEIDISKCRYESSLWKYAGLDVAPDGRGRSRRKEHLIEVEYVNKDGEPDTRMSITFNPFLKAKIIGVLGPSFLRTGDSPYADIYRDYKHRLENHRVYGIQNDGVKNEKGKVAVSKLRRHNMAVRYMVKRFLADLYVAWRTMEGLPVEPEYSVAKLKRKHVA